MSEADLGGVSGLLLGGWVALFVTTVWGVVIRARVGLVRSCILSAWRVG